MRAEEVIAAQLAHQVSRLSAGHRHRIMLEEVVSDGVGGWRPGPHVVGCVERPASGAVQIKVLGTMAGRTARALLEDELLDVVLSHDFPPAVRLTSEDGLPVLHRG